MEAKLKVVMARIFKVSPESVGPGASPDTIETWDSANHMNLVLALEEEFGVTFTDEQIVEMLSYELVIETLREAGVKI